MENKLCGDIAQIMYELAECGICPDMRKIKCNESNLPFHIMSHTEKEKAILIGLMRDLNNDEFVKSYIINFKKWNWASYEGFDIDDIFNSNLYKEIFLDIEPYEVSNYFLND